MQILFLQYYTGGDDLREVVMGTRRLMGAGWRDAECRRASLTAEDLESLDVFDFDMYIDPGCMETIEHRPNGCNFMGLGQGCRGCYETCEGALYYVKMHKTKIRKKVGKEMKASRYQGGAISCRLTIFLLVVV